ncbi:MAG: HesA/MoeB/ThiF family protein [Oscillospiraceae bacterium]|nr:HesA/MoeB/ThiF family protein [Oscillospiraceae bacterium]
MNDRYSAQTIISQIGPEGQKRLADASAVVVGAGGLGSPVLTYLVSAGIGRIGLIDHDTVSLSNLNRQFLHRESDVGRLKVLSAKEKLSAINSEVDIAVCDEYLTDQNAKTLLTGYDLILGCVDSQEARFVINRASAALRIPYIDGGVSGFNGCVMFSHPPKTPCLSCVFPDGESTKKPTGVIGPTAGAIGVIEANLALLWFLGLRIPIEGKLLLYDGLRMSTEFINIKRDSKCIVCGGISD